MIMIKPKIIESLKGYSLKQFQRDRIAGLIVAIIALLGGSRVQIGGPAGAFVVIIFGIVASYGYN